jgi:Txe/YoeB family toxin of Txe-Axe toxin-antitoxin module
MSVPLNPSFSGGDEGEKWKIVCYSQKVYKDWVELEKRVPESAERCLAYLCKHPMQRYPKRVFPLRGDKFRGVWEYEVTGADRVLYLPDPKTKTVTIYYAGKHPNSNPFPPSDA